MNKTFVNQLKQYYGYKDIQGGIQVFDTPEGNLSYYYKSGKTHLHAQNKWLTSEETSELFRRLFLGRETEPNDQLVSFTKNDDDIKELPQPIPHQNNIKKAIDNLIQKYKQLFDQNTKNIDYHYAMGKEVTSTDQLRETYNQMRQDNAKNLILSMVLDDLRTIQKKNNNE